MKKILFFHNFMTSSIQRFFRDQPFTASIVALCLIGYALEIILGKAFVVSTFGMTSRWLANGAYWQPVSHMFLHGGLLHLFFNLLVLWFAGRAVESWIGGRALVLVFFTGGIVGGLLQTWLVPGSLLIGASGGVSAVLLAFCTFEPSQRITALLFFVIPVKMRAITLGGLLIGLSLLFPLTGLFSGIGHFAHLGGALTGGAWGIWFRHLRRKVFRSGGLTATSLEEILDKVLRSGIQSLDSRERSVLEMWRSGR